MGKALRKLMTDQTGSALMFTLLISSILMVLALAVMTLTNNDYMITEARADSSKAKYVADSAVEIIKQQITDHERVANEPLTASEDGISIAGGQYDYEVIPEATTETGGLYTISVTAKVELPNGGTAQKKIEVTYLASDSNGGGGGNTPPGNTTALNFTVYQGGSNGMLHFDGGEFKCIGDIHSNSRIQLKDNRGNRDLYIEGTVTSAGDIKVIDKDGKEDKNLLDLTKVTLKENQPVIPIPIINWNYIKNLPGRKIYSGSTTLDGATLTGGETQKVVVFVNGDLTITGNISSNALIAATGNITIVGHGRYPDSDYHVAGIIAGKNINFEEDSKKMDETEEWIKVRGFVIALNNLNVNADTKIEGTLVAGNDIRIKEFLNLETKQEKPALEVLRQFGTQVISNYSQ